MGTNNLIYIVVVVILVVVAILLLQRLKSSGQGQIRNAPFLVVSTLRPGKGRAGGAGL